ncbi:MAG: sugar phosphate isomerase/epimerase [Planctomycetes bacterium]|nr:sugar phosphate isomerase/epimerase [Planctomycetota bacterium]
MSTISRRQFLGQGALALAAGTCLGPAVRALHAEPLGLPIGCQLYPVGKQIAQDFEGTLRQLAAIGYRTIELCSPPSYEKSGFAPLVKMTAAEVRKAFAAAGLRCESCHYQFQELKDKLDDRIAYAKELGLKHMILSTFGLRKDAAMADWLKAAGELNKIGEKVKKQGIQLGFHNHNFEFQEIDGVLIYDKLMSEFDPQLVKMQFQVAVISLGYQAATYLRKYPGRFCSLHLADWSSTEKRPVPVGSGVVDWKGLFAAAKIGGVENYFVEMNMDALKASYPFLRDLKV